MTEPSGSIYKRLRAARLIQGMTQSELAREVGCTQSAISMMERGNPHALSTEAVAAISARLGVNMTGAAPDERETAPSLGTEAICPAYDCPSNTPYVVRGEVYLLPATVPYEPTSPHCRFCGELLERRCPNRDCARPVTAGAACCQTCGTPYVSPPDIAPAAAETWVRLQCERLRFLRQG